MHVFLIGRLNLAATAAVKAVVHDWSAVGLVGTSVWLDIDGDPRSGLVIEDGRARSVDLPFWLPRHPGEIRLVSLQVLAEPTAGFPADAVRRVSDALRLPPGTPMVNLLVPVDGLTSIPPADVFDSQLNVLVQPVDGSSPGAVTEALTASSPTFAMHGAAALATAAGLWTGVRSAPLDPERPWSGTGVAVSRSYVRRLRSTPMVDRLALEVFGPGGALPVTRSTVGEPLGLVASGAQTQAAEAAGRAVLDKYGQVTRFHPPPPFVEPRRTALRFWQALGIFFSFVVKALLGSPRSWVDGMVNNTKARIEATTTRLLFGDQSRYTVVIKGLDAAGSGPVDQALALQDSALTLLGSVAPGSAQPSAAAPDLWDDAIKAAAALVDGGNPPAGVALPTQGTARLVINDPSHICAAPGIPAFRLPAGVPGAEFGPVAANDPYHALQIRRRLDEAARESGAGPGATDSGRPARLVAVQRAAGEFDSWLARRRSTMWSIGAGLAVELDRARAMQADVLQPVADLTEEELQAPLRAQRKARRGVLLWLAALVVLLAVSAALVGFSRISWQLGLAIALLSLLLCLAGALYGFIRSQRELFQALHRLDVAAALRAWLQEHAVTVTLEVIRLASLYRQSRAWSDVVGEYIHDPFGAVTDSTEAGIVPNSIVGELPLAMTLASAHFSADLHEPVVYQARARILRPGWLMDQIYRRRQLVLIEVNRRTGRDLENRLTSDVDLVGGGPLLSYLEGLRDTSLRSRTRDLAMTRLVEAVSDDGTADRLLPAVRVDAGAILRAQSWHKLTAELLTPADQLSHEGFSPTGITNRSSTIARSFLAVHPPLDSRQPFAPIPVFPMTGRDQLDRLVVRWDLSRPIPLDDLSYFGKGAGADETSDVPAADSVIDVQS